MGQKTSSVLNRALSRIEMRFRQRQVRLVWPKLREHKSYLSVETEETQLGSLGDQVSSYLYYTRYTERPSTDATWNTLIVRYESLRTGVITSHTIMSQYESVSNESLWVRDNAEMSIHISQTVNQAVPPVRQYLHTWSQRPGTTWGRLPFYFLTWPLGRSPECASW